MRTLSLVEGCQEELCSPNPAPVSDRIGLQGSFKRAAAANAGQPGGVSNRCRRQLFFLSLMMLRKQRCLRTKDREPLARHMLLVQCAMGANGDRGGETGFGW